jgi:hypothetical protein
MVVQLQKLLEQAEQFVVVDTTKLSARRDELIKKLGDEQNAERVWKNIRAAREEISRARTDANSLTAAADSLEDVGQKQLQTALDKFRAEVNAFLPNKQPDGAPGMELGIDIEANDDFGFVPEKETASKSAASDLRSAFGDF